MTVTSYFIVTTTSKTTSTTFTTSTISITSTTTKTSTTSTAILTTPIRKTMNVPVKMTPTKFMEESLSLAPSTKISTTETAYLNDETTISDSIRLSISTPAANVPLSRVFKCSRNIYKLDYNCSHRLTAEKWLTHIDCKPSLSVLLCDNSHDSSCEPATSMPDDEVEKLMESVFTTYVGDVSVEFNVNDVKNEPGESERTMVEDFPSTPLIELQDALGIYQET